MWRSNNRHPVIDMWGISLAATSRYKVTAEMVNFEVVPIINIPGGDAEIKVKDFGNTCAVAACLSLKIKNQHDKVKLKIAKHRCYLKGFETGQLLRSLRRCRLPPEIAKSRNIVCADSGWMAVVSSSSVK